MFRLSVHIDGLDSMEVDAAYAAHELDADLVAGSTDAAKYGVTSMQGHHPYTDRTRHLTDDMFVDGVSGPDGVQEAEIVVPAEYAQYVNEGTSRSLAYPFMPLGEHTAEEALIANAGAAVDRFREKLSR